MNERDKLLKELGEAVGMDLYLVEFWNSDLVVVGNLKVYSYTERDAAENAYISSDEHVEYKTARRLYQ